MDKSELLNQLRIARDTPPPATRWWWWIVAFVLLASGGAWAYRYYTASLIVRTALVQTITTRAPEGTVLDATGYVTARRQATVSSKVTGRVAEVLIEEGQQVAANEVLARLDPTDAVAAVNLAEAQVTAATALLVDLRVQLAQATRDSIRQQELVTRKLTSSQTAEDARSQVQSYTARLASQRQQIAVTQRAVEVAQVALDNTIVRAPFAGVVTVKAAQPGEIVSPISAGGGFTRTGIGTIVDMDSLEIEVDVNEAYISRVQAAQPVEAVLNAYPEWTIPARVITIIPAADRSKATVKVRIAIETKDPRIVPDMGVRVSFLEEAVKSAETSALPPGVQIPASAIMNAGDTPIVFVLEGARVRRLTVVLGQSVGEMRQVMSGLNAGERVVLAPPATLRDGQRVTVADDT